MKIKINKKYYWVKSTQELLRAFKDSLKKCCNSGSIVPPQPLPRTYIELFSINQNGPSFCQGSNPNFTLVFGPTHIWSGSYIDSSNQFQNLPTFTPLNYNDLVTTLATVGLTVLSANCQFVEVTGATGTAYSYGITNN
jgi:hypothetical protein